MTPERLADLHARCFTEAPRPWTAAEFAALLASTGAFVIPAESGFALGRVSLDEAEVLTLAVAPEARRRGQGRRLLAALEAEAAARGAGFAYLEVSEANTAARALYAGAGFEEVGRRPRYYAREGRKPLAALVMRKRLHPNRDNGAIPGKNHLTGPEP